MDQETIIQYITETFAEVEALRPTDGPGAGDSFFYYDPAHTRDFSSRQPFATIVVKDYGDFDNTSQLDRPDVYRLNINVSRETFQSLLGFAPNEAPAKSGAYDFAALDRLMPHPIYAPQSWVCVLNPSAEAFEVVKPLLAEAYTRDVARYGRKHGQDARPSANK